MIGVRSRYHAEDEAIVGLLCKLASKKYGRQTGYINTDGILLGFGPDGDEKIHISDVEQARKCLEVIFEFRTNSKPDKQLIIMNHSLEEYAEITSGRYGEGDVILIKNYIPSYKSERTLFGPNGLKQILGREVKVFAIELDVRIQNSIFHGVMEGMAEACGRRGTNQMLSRRLLTVFNEISKEV